MKRWRWIAETHQPYWELCCEDGRWVAFVQAYKGGWEIRIWDGTPATWVQQAVVENEEAAKVFAEMLT